ncbi:MAG: transcriptional regulator domain-containing protein, partial [Candidatus Paceibacteria bacterium]
MTIRKDWRNPEEYDFTEELDFLGWAWEFIRRNPEYQRDYYLQLNDKEEFYELNSEDYPDMSFFEICEKKWGIQEFVDPEDDHPNIDISLSNIPSPGLYGNDYIKAELDESSGQPNVVWYRFDLNYKIPGQTEKAKEYLEKRKAAFEKLRPEIGNKEFSNKKLHHTIGEGWVTHLRALDAEYEYKHNNTRKITKNEIAEIIYPKSKRDYPHPQATNSLDRIL